MDGEATGMMGTGKEMVLKSRTKWLWVGLAIALFLPPVPGFIFGFSLLTEKPYRKQALIIIAWTIVWWAATWWWGYHILSTGVQLISQPNVIR